MRINNLKINSFGKIKNKEINLEDGINIIYGKNETGKSTILNFIFNSFYGISKNKKGKNISDYDKFKPINGEDFSGKIEYQLDSKKKYEIYRDFNKKNPKIYNDNSEEISNQFNIDKKNGNEFFYEQTKIDEDLFCSTIGIFQKEVELEKNNQNFLVQKLANLAGTGEDNISYKRAIDRINKRQLEEVGTERSREKPINIINKKITELENEKNNLEEFQDAKYEINDEENKLINKIEELKNKNKYLNELKLLIENNKIEKEKIKIKENLLINNEDKINNLKNELIIKKDENNKNNEKIINENKNIKKQINKINKNIILYFILLIIINLLVLFFTEGNIKYFILLTIPIYCFICYIIKKQIKNKYNNNINNNDDENKILIKSIENQINILEENNNNLENEIKKLKSNYNLKNNLEQEKIKNKYRNIINEKDFVNSNLENLNYIIKQEQEKINFEELQLHKLKLNKENIEPKLDKLANIEEKLNQLLNEKEELQELNKSIDLTKQVLEESYIEMKENITPKFTNNLSKIISLISNNKYNKIKFNDENGIIVELDSGDYMQIDKLSKGTIEQLYLSLRISMLDDLSEEILPIFLDEAFVYYDNERLQNILMFLYKESQKRQIFIFTCSKREIDILNSLNINFNLIEI